MARGDRCYALHVREPSVEVHRDDRFRPRRNGELDEHRIKIACAVLDVDEHRLRANGDHRLRRGDKGVGRGDNLISGSDVQRPQNELESARSAADPVSVGCPAETAESGFELQELLAPDKAVVEDHAIHGEAHVLLDRLILRAKIDQGNLPGRRINALDLRRSRRRPLSLYGRCFPRIGTAVDQIERTRHCFDSPNLPGGDAEDDRSVFDCPRDHASSAYEGAFADFDAGRNENVRR